MRSEVLNYLKSLKSKNYTYTDVLPFETGKTTLYQKNANVLYVGEEQVTREPIIECFDSVSDIENASVTIYFSNDAKKLPSDYEDVVAFLRDTQSIDAANKYSKRSSVTETEFDNDMIVTRVEVRFSRIIN